MAGLDPVCRTDRSLGSFFFQSRGGGCGSHVGFGWYVDEMTIETGPETSFVPSENSRRVGVGGRRITLVERRRIGRYGKLACRPVDRGAAHAGTNCAATVLNGNYPEDRDSRLVSQPFVVPPASTNPRLRFWHWWSFGSCDYGQMQISSNNGTSWMC